MKVENVNWGNAWEKKYKERHLPLKVTFDPKFGKKFAKDYFERAKYSNYEYGRKVIDVLSKILDKHFEVLEIGSGPGTLTIPLAKKVKKITAVESSEAAVDYLWKNIKESKIENVEIMNKNWLEVGNREIKDKFDLAICSHFLWQMKNIEKHLKKMENASGKYCAIVQPAQRDRIVKEEWTKITGEGYSGQFDPDADYFVYPILRQWERLPNVRTIEYNIGRNIEQEVRYIASFLGRFMEVDLDLKETITKHVAKYFKNDTYIESCYAVVLWWKIF